jgi:hypothetical protein
MKKLLAICALALLTTTIALGQNGTASSKATAAINTSVYCNVTNWTTLGDPVMTCHDVFGGNPILPTADNFIPVMQTTGEGIQ